MLRISVRNFSYQKILVTLFWLAGIVIGCLVLSMTSDPSFTMMRSVNDGRLTIVGLLFMMFLPLLISAFLLRSSIPYFVLLLIFLKAFCFSYVAGGVFKAFGSAGWLLRWLLVFSDSCCVVLFLWFCLKNFSCEKQTLLRDLLICLVGVAVFCCVDYCVIAPFVDTLPI